MLTSTQGPDFGRSVFYKDTARLPANLSRHTVGGGLRRASNIATPIPHADRKVPCSLVAPVSHVSTDSYPDDLNPFAEKTGDAHPAVIAVRQKLNTSDSLENSAGTHFQENISGDPDGVSKYGPGTILLQLLNQYLRSQDGKSVGVINKKHVAKIKQDIKSNSTIARYITLAGETGEAFLEWKTEPAGKEDVQHLLDAFKTRHKGRGSFYQMLSNFSFPQAGYRVIDSSAHENIIHEAAKPGMHRPGKHAIVEMKHTAMTDALEHFSAPSRHNQSLPKTVLEPLIAHYGRMVPDLERAQHVAENLVAKHVLSLNDGGFVEAIQRFFHRIKTDSRIERFDNDVNTAAHKFKDQLAEELKRVKEQHAPEHVAQRVKMKLDQHLNKAYIQYSKKMPGINIYPQRLDHTSATARQIDSTAYQNFHTVLKGIVSKYEMEFVESLSKGVSSFSAVNYFHGKSREKAVDNIIKINKSISSLYEVAEVQHNANMQMLIENMGGDDLAEDIPTVEFNHLQQGLSDNIKKKLVENYQVALGLYHRDIDSIKSVKNNRFSSELKQLRILVGISEQLSADVTKIRTHRFAGSLNVEPETLNNGIQEVTKPILSKIKEHLPKVKSIGETLRSAFARAFKPTPAKIIGGIPLLGGLAFSLATLPTAFAVPLGIATAVILPVALLGWVGWNIYKRFEQRGEMRQLCQQIETQLQNIDGNMEVV